MLIGVKVWSSSKRGTKVPAAQGSGAKAGVLIVYDVVAFIVAGLGVMVSVVQVPEQMVTSGPAFTVGQGGACAFKLFAKKNPAAVKLKISFLINSICWAFLLNVLFTLFYFSDAVVLNCAKNLSVLITSVPK